MHFGRRDSPIEHDIGDVIGQRHVLDRTIRAQVRSVDAENGFVILVYENMPGGGKYTTIQPLWMSFPDSNIGNPAWGRFIPQEGDLVRVSFDYDDRPVIVGFDIVAEKPNVADGISGWPALNEQYKNARGPNAPADKAKFAQFTPLKPGEYDFMSSGGAYIYGNNQGRLYLSGGGVSITLAKNDLRLAIRSQLHSFSADDCEFRFGQVRRTNPANQLDEKVSSDTNGLFKEFAVTLKKTVSAGTSTPLATFKLGNVVDDSGAVEQGSNPYRLLYQSFIDSGTEALKMTIDNLGNWDVLAPEQATTGVTFDFSMGDWTTKFKNSAHNSDDSFTINSDVIKFQGKSGSPAAEHPLFKSKIYKDAETKYAGDAATEVKNLAQAVASLSNAISTFCTAVTASTAGAIGVPPGSPLPSVVGIGTAATTLLAAAQSQGTAATGVATNAPTVATTFTGQYDSYFSTIAKTG